MSDSYHGFYFYCVKKKLHCPTLYLTLPNGNEHVLMALYATNYITN